MSDVALLEKIQRVGRRARKLLWLRALLMAISAGLLWALATVLLDYVLRMELPVLRWLLSIGAVAGMVGVSIRWLGPVLRLRSDEVRTARWIERSLPALQNRLSSAVQFLRDPPHDALAGSTDLRSALVRQTNAQLCEIDIDRVLDNRGVRRAAWVGVATLVMLVTTASSHPVDLRVGLARLAFPWKPLRWPTDHALSFGSLPTQVAQGSSIHVEVVDRRGKLPERVQLHYWPQGSRSTEIVRFDMRRQGDTAEWTLPNVNRSFRLRAVGGDHQDMAWVSVKVVKAPALVDVRLSVESPAYTGWPPESAEAHFQALKGSRVWLDARANRPLRQANLVWRDDTGASDTIPLSVAKDGWRVTLNQQGSHEWRIRDSVRYRFGLVDQRNIRADPSYGSITALADQPPTVELRQPTADWVGNPRALVPLQVQVADDLTVQRVQLLYMRSDLDPDHEYSIPLFQRSAPPRSSSEMLQGPDRQTIDTDWDLSQIEGLQAGVVLSWYVAVEDIRGQRSGSPIREWTLPSDDELQRRFARQEQEILTRMSEVVASQEQAREALERVVQAWQQGISTPGESTDELQAVSLAQRSVRESLTESPGSILHDLRQQLDAMRRSRVDSRRRQHRQREWIARLQQLDVFALDPLEALLNRSVYHASQVQQATESGNLAAELPNASRLQHQVIQQLQEILVDLRQQDVLQTLLQQLLGLREGQQALLTETVNLVEVTVSHSAESMPDSLREQLMSLQDRQFELARKAEQIMADLDAAATDAHATDAERLAQARQTASRTGLTHQMRRAAEELRRTRVGNAAQQQRDIGQILQQLLDNLQGRGPTPPTGPRFGSDSANVATDRDLNIDVVRQELQTMLLRQDEIGQATVQLDRRYRQPDAEPDLVLQLEALAGQQGQLAEAAQSLSEEVTTLRVSSWLLKQIARDMRRVSDLLQQRGAGAATQESQRVVRTQLSRLLQIWQADAPVNSATTESVQPQDQDPPLSTDADRDGMSLPPAEIQLLVFLQRDLNQRTRRLSNRRASGEEPTEETKRLLGELAQQQGQLANLLEQLLSSPGPEEAKPPRR